LVETNFPRHIAKLPVAEVLVQSARVTAEILFLRAVEITATGEKNIQKAVAVVVDQADAAAHGLDDDKLVSVVAVAVGEAHSRIGSHVAEGDVCRQLGLLRARSAGSGIGGRPSAEIARRSAENDNGNENNQYQTGKDLDSRSKSTAFSLH